jgi:GNAT superfamily N-acetyltransferase
MRASITVRRAVAGDRARVDVFCRERGYQGFVSPEALVVVAESGADLVGIGRVQVEDEVLVLRGMRVDAPYRHRGVGTRLLELLAAGIESRVCYCIPYSHLAGFYQHAGFVEQDPATAPVFLQLRLKEYRKAGNDVILMLRPARPDA